MVERGFSYAYEEYYCLRLRSLSPPSSPVMVENLPVTNHQNKISSGTNLVNLNHLTPREAPPVNNSLSVQDRFNSLVSIPTFRGRLSFAWAKAFRSQAAALANQYINSASADAEKTLFDILALPKMALQPGIQQAKSEGNKKALDDFMKYPGEVINPPERTTGGFDQDIGTKSEKQCERGLISNAARTLVDDTAIHNLTDDVVKKLADLHPAGEKNPFANQGRAPVGVPDKGKVEEALNSFAKDTGAGVSGWTVPLMLLAFKEEAFQRFLTLLTSQINQGIAPGRGLLNTSRITPLVKPDGGVRPIACNELMYRVAAKAILKQHFKPSALQKGQVGVGTPGGIEVVIRAVEKMVSGESNFKHVLSLDFSNAYNTVSRKSMAKEIQENTPSLYRTAKWAYGNPTTLAAANGDKQVSLQSAQGVRQGDPLAPVFFSIALKPVMTKLQNILGSSGIVLSYLDDVYILSDDDVKEKIFKELDDMQLSIQLNKKKSFGKSIEEIHSTGMELLGTVVGPKSIRVSFIRKQLEVVKKKLSCLSMVRDQYAWILLSKSYQASLRHLQRSLDLSDSMEEWQAVDNTFHATVRSLRGSKHELDTDEDLFHLPTYYGGLGISSHVIVAPHARKAMAEQADSVLERIFQANVNLESPVVTKQKTYTDRVNKDKWKNLEDRLDVYGKCQLSENGTKLGRKPLTSLPFEPGLRFTNAEFKSLLHIRTLCPGAAQICQCGQRNVPGHDDVCRDRVQMKTKRHDAIRNYLAKFLSAAGLKVDMEMPLGSSDNKRMDLVLKESNGSGALTMHDITVHSSIALVPYIQQVTKDWQKKSGSELIRGGLNHQAHKKVLKYRDHVPVTFVPIVFGAGGAMSTLTTEHFKQWRRITPNWDHLQRLISFALVRKRVTNFRLI